MIEKLSQSDRYLKSKSQDQFVEFIRTELEAKARANNKNPLAVKMPDDASLVYLRQELLPDVERRPVTKNDRRLHVLHDWMTQFSLIGSLGSLLFGGALPADPLDTSNYLIQASLFMNQDWTSFQIDLVEQEDTPVFLAAGSREYIKAHKRNPARAATNATEGDEGGPSQRRTLHISPLVAADGKLLHIVALIKDRSFKNFVLQQVSPPPCNHYLPLPTLPALPTH